MMRHDADYMHYLMPKVTILQNRIAARAVTTCKFGLWSWSHSEGKYWPAMQFPSKELASQDAPHPIRRIEWSFRGQTRTEEVYEHYLLTEKEHALYNNLKVAHTCMDTCTYMIYVRTQLRYLSLTKPTPFDRRRHLAILLRDSPYLIPK